MTCGDHLYFIAILLATFLQGIVDACGRTPAKPKSTPSPPPTVETTTQKLQSNRKNCTEEEAFQRGCLNEGTCFAVQLGGQRTLSCSCLQLYTGQRCEEISNDLFVHEEEKVVTASIAAGVSVLVILLTMGIIYAVIRVKRKRNRMETRLNGGPKNGTLLKRVSEFDSPDEGEDSITEEEKKQKPLINNHHHHHHFLNDIQNCNRETKV